MVREPLLQGPFGLSAVHVENLRLPTDGAPLGGGVTHVRPRELTVDIWRSVGTAQNGCRLFWFSRTLAVQLRCGPGTRENAATASAHGNPCTGWRHAPLG